MNKRIILGIIGVIVVVALGFGLYATMRTQTGTTPTTEDQKPTGHGSGPLESVLQTYTNNKYSFEIKYPSTYIATTTFPQYYVLSNTWRAGAVSPNTGTDIVSIPIYHVENANSYPRYYAVEVRIGASSNKADVAACYNDDENGAGTPVETVTINGTTFKKFTIGDHAMMQYVEGVSYRTIKNGNCIAIEQLKAGSNYRDDPQSAKDISDAELQSYYNAASSIVDTFTFITPQASPENAHKGTVTVSAALQQKVSGNGVSITPTEVVEDSRCPQGVQCIWAGTVKVKATIVSGMGSSVMTLELNKPVTTESEIITLTNVDPYPMNPSMKKPTTPYLFTFTIEKR